MIVYPFVPALPEYVRWEERNTFRTEDGAPITTLVFYETTMPYDSAQSVECIRSGGEWHGGERKGRP